MHWHPPANTIASQTTTTTSTLKLTQHVCCYFATLLFILSPQQQQQKIRRACVTALSIPLLQQLPSKRECVCVWRTNCVCVRRPSFALRNSSARENSLTQACHPLHYSRCFLSISKRESSFFVCVSVSTGCLSVAVVAAAVAVVCVRWLHALRHSQSKRPSVSFTQLSSSLDLSPPVISALTRQKFPDFHLHATSERTRLCCDEIIRKNLEL